MGWTTEPKIRDLEPYAKKHGYQYVVVMGVHRNGETFDVNSYGETKQLCKVAKIAGEQLFDMIVAGEWPEWPESEPH